MNSLDESNAELKAAYEAALEPARLRARIAGLDEVVEYHEETIDQLKRDLTMLQGAIRSSVKKLGFVLDEARASEMADKDVLDDIEDIVTHMNKSLGCHGNYHAE